MYCSVCAKALAGMRLSILRGLGLPTGRPFRGRKFMIHLKSSLYTAKNQYEDWKSNQRASLDAAMTLLLHSEHYQIRASERQR
jgi:hypothetical protein